MTAPRKPWQEMSAAEKRDAVKPLIIQGTGYSKIADMLGAPNRHCVAGVVNRLREMGALPKAPSRQTTGSMSGTISRVKAKARQAKKASAPRPSAPASRPQAKPQRKPTAKLIALPGASSPRQVSNMVDAYIAANGVRRFERGMSNDLDALRGYVSRHGYEIDFTQRGKHPYTIRNGRGRPRQVDRDGLFAFVDDLRIADGKEPFLPRNT